VRGNNSEKVLGQWFRNLFIETSVTNHQFCFTRTKSR